MRGCAAIGIDSLLQIGPQKQTLVIFYNFAVALNNHLGMIVQHSDSEACAVRTRVGGFHTEVHEGVAA
jgi:hypothetical protein